MTQLPEKIRFSVMKRIAVIASDSFSQDDVKLLLIELREYLPKQSLIKEIAHFVAHPDRDRGIIHETVNYAYNRCRVLFRQLEGNKTGKGLELDLASLPEDVHDTVEWHFTRIAPNPKKLVIFKKAYRYNSKTNSYVPKGEITHKIVGYIKEAIGILSLQPALTQNDIIEEIKKDFQFLGLEDRVSVIHEKQNGIMACVLSMLHQSYFTLADGFIAKAHMSNEPIIETLDVPISLQGVVKTELSPASIAFTLVSSNLTVSEFFSDNMYDRTSAFPRTRYSEDDHIDVVRDVGNRLVFVKHDTEPKVAVGQAAAP